MVKRQNCAREEIEGRVPDDCSMVSSRTEMEMQEEAPRPILRMKRPKNRKTKSVLIFDEAVRREYLTGFQKRKNQRRKKAKLENEKKIKEEKQALKQQVREMVQKSDRHRLPEVEEFLNSTVHDLPEHTVTITDMSDRLTAAPHESGPGQLDKKQLMKDGEEDSEVMKKKRKKLINKLAQVGNAPSSKRRKVKRLGKGKFKGAGGKSGSGAGSGGKMSKKKKSGNKKHRHQ